MSKRLVRLLAKEVPQRFGALDGKDVHVVDRLGKACFGRMTQCSEAGILVRDYRNHEHFFEIDDVQEVVYDQESTW